MQHLTPNVKEMKKSDPPICPGREEEPESWCVRNENSGLVNELEFNTAARQL